MTICTILRVTRLKREFFSRLKTCEVQLRCLIIIVTTTIIGKALKQRRKSPMNYEVVQQYISLLRQSYQVTSYQNKRKVIQEVRTNLGWHPKSAIRALNRDEACLKKHSGRPQKYSAGSMIHLKKLWLKMDQICSNKLAAI